MIRFILFALLLPFPAQGACADPPAPLAASANVGHAGMVRLEGGRFIMGENAAYPEERPAHENHVDPFWIDRFEVTNRQFAAFVAATGYITLAERDPPPGSPWPGPGSAVFATHGAETVPRWRFVEGAHWRAPTGPGSNIEGLEDHPVVQIAHVDAQAYASWAGRRLPTEAEWEYAARAAGKATTLYAWGTELAPAGLHQANSWQGLFPFENSAVDGHEGTAPVGCFPANETGLYDMIGNVWEWTNDPYRPRHDAPTALDPRQPEVPARVIKGGSFLCSPNFCARYRPAARQAQETGLGTNHIGFRTAQDADDQSNPRSD